MTGREFRLGDDLSRNRWLYLAIVVALAIWCAVDVVHRGEVNAAEPMGHRTDFTVYTEAGAAFFDGRNPYEVANPRGWRYLYMPMFAILVAPLHVLPMPAQVCVWFVLSAITAYGCYYETRRLLCILTRAHREQDGREFQVPSWLGPAALLAVLLPVLNCLQRGQVEILKVYLLLLGFRLLVSGRRSRDWWLAGVVLALPVVLKLTPFLPVGCVVFYEALVYLLPKVRHAAWTRPFSLGMGVGSGLVLFILLVPAAVTDWDSNLRHLGRWYDEVVTKVNDVRSSDFGEDVTSVRNQSLDNGTYRFGNWVAYMVGGPIDTAVDRPHPGRVFLPMDSPVSGIMIQVIRWVALVSLLLVTIRAAIWHQPVGFAAVFGLACLVTLIACPVSRGLYFVLVLPALVFGSLWLVQLGHERIGRIVAFTPAVLIWLHYVAMSVSGRLGVLGLGTTAWYLAMCLMLDRAAREMPLRAIWPQSWRRAAPASIEVQPVLAARKVA